MDPTVVMRSAQAVFEAMAADGQAGQEADQGMGNYYRTDPVEVRNIGQFLRRLRVIARVTGNYKVLVAGCGDGLETELLLEEGFQVTAFDYAANMVEVIRTRFSAYGEQLTLFVADVTNLDITGDFAGVLFAQVAQFLPVAENDPFMRAAITSFSALAPHGVIYVATTQYPEPEYVREWAGAGPTTYYARPAESIQQMLEDGGFVVAHFEHYDSSTEYPDERYQNDYFVAVRPEFLLEV